MRDVMRLKKQLQQDSAAQMQNFYMFKMTLLSLSRNFSLMSISAQFPVSTAAADPSVQTAPRVRVADWTASVAAAVTPAWCASAAGRQPYRPRLWGSGRRRHRSRSRRRHRSRSRRRRLAKQ